MAVVGSEDEVVDFGLWPVGHLNRRRRGAGDGLKGPEVFTCSEVALSPRSVNGGVIGAASISSRSQ